MRTTFPTRFSKAKPCPVCLTGSKGCSATADGLHWCRGAPADPAGWKCVKPGETFSSYRRFDDLHERNGHTRPSPRPSRAKPAANWGAEAERYARDLSPERRTKLAQCLGLPTASLDALPLIGWYGSAWTFPEYDGAGLVVGLATRDTDGGKKMLRGGHRGLTISDGWRDRPGALFVPEGASDVLALSHVGLAAVGRPSNAGGADQLAALLANLPAGQDVIVLGENDHKDDGTWPGKSGAEKVAATLTSKLARSIHVAFPPKEYKDARDWVCDLAAGQGENEDWPAIGVAIVEHCSATAITLPPVPDSSRPDREPCMLILSSVQPAPVTWLWPDRIPSSRITVLAGRPGCGKSILSLELAAHVTRGLDWPDGSPCPQGSVLLLAAEDDYADTVRPRLDAADADTDRVFALQGVRTRGDNGRTSTSGITLADIDAIEAAVEMLPDCKLLIIDPIGSYLGSRTDAHRDNEVRSVLAPLAALASRRGISVVVVCHTRKGGAGTHADDAVLGSVGFVGLARAVLHAVSDPDDATRRRKLLLPGKNNLAPPMAGFAFHVEGRPPRVVWEGMTGHDADKVLSAACRPGPEPVALREAVEWLRGALAHGPRLAKDVDEEARKGEGISKTTLERAKQAAKVKAYRLENPGPWYWRLPEGT